MNMEELNDRKRMLSALQNCDFRLTEVVGQPINVCDYVVHDVEVKGKTEQELIPCVRLVLLDIDGATYECVSQTLLRSFQRVVFAYGEPPWPNPLTLTPRTKKKGERSIYWFDVG